MLVNHDHHGSYECMCANGEGICTVSDMRLSQNEREKFSGEKPEQVSFYIYEGVTAIERGGLDVFHGLRELFIADSVREIGVSPELEAILRNNRVLIRGNFNSYAEKFARKYGLPFLHSDIELSREPGHEERSSVMVTLRFNSSGTPRLHQDYRCQGIAASCTGGGENDVPLPVNFYKTMTTEDIADKCWGSAYHSIVTSSRLKKFLKTAKERGGYYFTE